MRGFEGPSTAIMLRSVDLRVAKLDFRTTAVESEAYLCPCPLGAIALAAMMVENLYLNVDCCRVSRIWKNLRKTLCEGRGLGRQHQRFEAYAIENETWRLEKMQREPSIRMHGKSEAAMIRVQQLGRQDAANKGTSIR